MMRRARECPPGHKNHKRQDNGETFGLFVARRKPVEFASGFTSKQKSVCMSVTDGFYKHHSIHGIFVDVCKQIISHPGRWAQLHPDASHETPKYGQNRLSDTHSITTARQRFEWARKVNERPNHKSPRAFQQVQSEIFMIGSGAQESNDFWYLQPSFPTENHHFEAEVCDKV
jgi:hypothetical protein